MCYDKEKTMSITIVGSRVGIGVGRKNWWTTFHECEVHRSESMLETDKHSGPGGGQWGRLQKRHPGLVHLVKM